MPGDPGIRTPQLMQLADDVAHQVDIVRASGPVMPDRACHPAVDGLIDDRYRQFAAFPFVNCLLYTSDAADELICCAHRACRLIKEHTQL